MNTNLYRLGVERVGEQIKARKSLVDVLIDFSKDTNPVNAGLFGGALSIALDLVTSAKAEGVVFGGSKAEMRILDLSRAKIEIEALRAYASADRAGLARVCMAVGLAVDALNRNGRIGWASGQNKSEPPPAPAPLRVEIVSMPTRKTASLVESDSAGNIIGSTQTEQDAA